jgi:hypothetical protein
MCIITKSYVHPSNLFKLIFQCSHKSFVIFMYAFEYLIFPPVIIPLDLTTSNETKAYITSIKKKNNSGSHTCTVFYLSHIFRMLICFSVTCDLLTVEDLLIHETS